METGWKRPKELPSNTEHVETNCGTLHFIMGNEDGKLVEVRGVIGKNGTCANVQLDTICKLVSIYLQSPEPRYKIIKKFKKQFMDMGCGQGVFTEKDIKYHSCVDYIINRVIDELNKQT